MVIEYLQANGVGVQLHYAPVHLQPYYKELGFQSGNYPNAERYATDALSLFILDLNMNNNSRW